MLLFFSSLRCLKIEMWLLSSWEELKELVLRRLPLLWTLQFLVVGRLTSKTGWHLATILKFQWKVFSKTLHWSLFDGVFYRFTLPSHLVLKNFEGLDLRKLDKVCDYIATFHYCYEILKTDGFIHYWSSSCCCYFLFGITFQTSDSNVASYVAGPFDQSFNWKVI